MKTEQLAKYEEMRAIYNQQKENRHYTAQWMIFSFIVGIAFGASILLAILLAAGAGVL